MSSSFNISEIIKLTCSEEVNLINNISKEKMLILEIEALKDTCHKQAEFKITGLKSCKSCCVYLDNFQSKAEIKSSLEDSVNFTKELLEVNLIFIIFEDIPIAFIDKEKFDPKLFSINIEENVWCLEEDFHGILEIDEKNVTIDGNNHSIIGEEVPVGIFLSNNKDISIKKINILNDEIGIMVYNSSNVILSNIRCDLNRTGLWAYKSDRLEISSSSFTFSESTGISLNKVSDIYLHNNNIKLCRSYGVLSRDIDGIKIIDNNIAQCEKGIYIDSKTSLGLIQGNKMNSCKTAIKLKQENMGLSIVSNSISGCKEAIDAMGSCDLSVKNNSIYNCEKGLSIKECRNSIFSQNTIAFSKDYAVNLTLGSFCKFELNEIFTCINGIIISDTHRISVIENSICHNKDKGIILIKTGSSTIAENLIKDNLNYGLVLLNSYNNEVYNNNFILNGKQVISIGTANVFSKPMPVGGNFWSDHDAVDENGDKIFDSPYEVCKDCIDEFPYCFESAWKS